MKKNYKIASIAFAVGAVSFFAVAIAFFVHKNPSMGATFLCLGSCNLCLSSVFVGLINRQRREAEQKDHEDTDKNDHQ